MTNPAYMRINNAPPAEFIPPSGRKLVSEFNDLRVKSNAASLAASRHNSDKPAEQAARQRDADAVATATRAGKTVKEPNEHLLAHLAKGHELQAEADALKAAFDQVSREMSIWAVENAEEIEEYAQKLLTTAHADYTALFPALQEASTVYHRSRAVVGWAEQIQAGSSIVSYVDRGGSIIGPLEEDASQHLDRTTRRTIRV